MNTDELQKVLKAIQNFPVGKCEVCNGTCRVEPVGTGETVGCGSCRKELSHCCNAPIRHLDADGCLWHICTKCNMDIAGTEKHKIGWREYFDEKFPYQFYSMDEEDLSSKTIRSQMKKFIEQLLEHQSQAERIGEIRINRDKYLQLCRCMEYAPYLLFRKHERGFYIDLETIPKDKYLPVSGDYAFGFSLSKKINNALSLNLNLLKILPIK